MGGFDVTPTQFAALAKLDDAGPISQNQLGRLIAMDPATIFGVVGRLAKRGYVRQSVDESDARVVLVMLTDEGRAAVTAHEAPSRPRSRAGRSSRSRPRRRTRFRGASPRSGDGACSPAPSVQSLAGDRLHLSHGPIDVVLRAWGAEGEVRRAHEAVVARFATVLAELAGELDELRRPIAEEPRVEGPVARRMVAAVRPFAADFITPMAAVAGSVADELLAAMLGGGGAGESVRQRRRRHRHPPCRRVSVLPSASPATSRAGAVPALNGAVMLRAEDGIGGIATSGFNGRSFTLGIADSVTVVAASAAAADAAATRRRERRRPRQPGDRAPAGLSARSGQRPRRPPRHERRRPPDRGRDPAGADERPVERRALDRARPHRRRRLDASGAKPRCGGAGARGAARDPGPGSLKAAYSGFFTPITSADSPHSRSFVYE